MNLDLNYNEYTWTNELGRDALNRAIDNLYFRQEMATSMHTLALMISEACRFDAIKSLMQSNQIWSKNGNIKNIDSLNLKGKRVSSDLIKALIQSWNDLCNFYYKADPKIMHNYPRIGLNHKEIGCGETRWVCLFPDNTIQRCRSWLEVGIEFEKSEEENGELNSYIYKYDMTLKSKEPEIKKWAVSFDVPSGVEPHPGWKVDLENEGVKVREKGDSIIIQNTGAFYTLGSKKGTHIKIRLRCPDNNDGYKNITGVISEYSYG
jgi:hypothetical protein